MAVRVVVALTRKRTNAIPPRQVAPVPVDQVQRRAERQGVSVVLPTRLPALFPELLIGIVMETLPVHSHHREEFEPRAHRPECPGRSFGSRAP